MSRRSVDGKRRDDRASLRWGGWAAVGAGVAGVAGLLSVIPWPELFAPDASPASTVYFEPELRIVLVGHYAILATGGVLGLAAALVLVFAFARRRVVALAAMLVAVGSATLAFAATARGIELARHDGRSTADLEMLVWGGGTVLLFGVLLLTLALRQRAGRTFLVLGVGAPVLVTAGIATFVLVGPDVYPSIWGVTFPPPSDYLLAIWFIGLGRVMMSELAGRRCGSSDESPPRPGAHEVAGDVKPRVVQ